MVAALEPALARGTRPTLLPSAIFCDMDGSTLDDRHVITARTRESFQRYRQSGGIIVFSTGRALASCVSKCELASFWPDLCITSFGTTLFRPMAAVPHSAMDTVLQRGSTKKLSISSQMASDFVALWSEKIDGIHFWFDKEGEGPVVECAEATRSLVESCMPGVINDYPFRSVDSVELFREALTAQEEVVGLIVWVRGKGIKQLSQALLDACESEEQRAVLCRHKIAFMGLDCKADGTSAVVLTSQLAGKAPTLRLVCAQLGMASTDDVWAFGDSSNDTEMFQAAGWSCACASADPIAKQLASAVSTRTNNDLNFIAAELDLALGGVDGHADI